MDAKRLTIALTPEIEQWVKRGAKRDATTQSGFIRSRLLEMVRQAKMFPRNAGKAA